MVLFVLFLEKCEIEHSFWRHEEETLRRYCPLRKIESVHV